MSIPVIPNTIAGDADIDLNWATSVSTSEGGIAGRKGLRPIPQRQFHITLGPDDAATIAAIYRASFGPLYPVAIRDWSDYQFTNEVLVWLVDGGNTFAQLSKTYRPSSTYSFTSSPNAESFTYPILLPDTSETPLVIKVNGVTHSHTLNDFGVVEIASALSSGDVVTASGEYLVPACFMEDTMTIKMITGYTSSVDSVSLREIQLAELQQLLATIPA